MNSLVIKEPPIIDKGFFSQDTSLFKSFVPNFFQIVLRKDIPNSLGNAVIAGNTYRLNPCLTRREGFQ